MGTVDYAAPEQICGRPLDRRTDVYGLGGLLHFALTGLPPFEGETDDARLRSHLFEPPPAPSRMRPGLPAAIDAVIACALAKDPAARYATAGELGRAAVQAAARAGVVPPATARGRVSSPSRCTDAEAPTVAQPIRAGLAPASIAPAQSSSRKPIFSVA
jgi:serine/threonine-protein kinase